MLLPQHNVELYSMQMKSVPGQKREFALRLIWKLDGLGAPYEHYVTDLLIEQQRPWFFYLNTGKGLTQISPLALPFDEWLKACSPTKESKKHATTGRMTKRKRKNS